MHHLGLMLAAAWHVIVVQALISLGTIRNLTDLSRELRGRILEVGGEVVEMAGNVGGQVVLDGSGVGKETGGNGDKDDVEDTITASLQTLCSTLLVELEKPGSHFGQPVEDQPCNKTTAEYHEFLAATVQFLHVVQERQMRWRWGHDSAMKDGVGWLQSLWASSRPNSQHLSFIQQQLALYDTTGCFGTTKEVLRRSVEIVEYLNDLVDEFN